MRIAIACVLVVLPLFGAAAVAADVEPKTEEQKVFYAMGFALSTKLAAFNLSKAELEMVEAGLSDGTLKNKPKVELQVYAPKIGELQQARMAAAAEQGKKSAQAYLEKAAAEKGSAKTASGLIFTPVKEGAGAAPTTTDTVKVHYQGALIDGNVFDSSILRGQPTSLPVSGVIPCWTEGLQRMKVGGKAKFVCPAEIAYGDRGNPPVIPPGATLVFEIELLEVTSEK
jgi:FKBP-type peptidyl-prolyl cis-trans isomerase FkpA/FKBP-type peptidyl-prolyl cis-trans isomerase FklB